MDVPVFRKYQKEWQIGEVQSYDIQTSKHLISFIGGDKEWAELSSSPTKTYLEHHKKITQGKQHELAMK
eukprot:4952918-Ditylum_brightwellii.AAC.1